MKTVLTTGCYDVLHAGHVRHLQTCRNNGDWLVVALNTDASVRRRKGPLRPINSQEQRLEVLRAVRYVDCVTLFDTDEDLLRIVANLQPAIFQVGEEYVDRKIVAREAVEEYGGTIVFTSLQCQVSTTAIVDRVRSMLGKVS